MEKRKFTSFAMFGSMRSGSILLENYLCQFEGLVGHGELFNPGLIRQSEWGEYLGVSRKDRLDNPELMLDAIFRENPDKISGYRIFENHNQWAIDNALDDPHCAKIILTRDPLESFVSLGIARETGQWMISDASHRKVAKMHFDLAEFAQYKKERRAYYSKIAKSLEQSGQPSFEVDYLMLGDVATINQMAAFIGSGEIKYELIQKIKKQNPEPLSEKISNYHDVFQALGLPEVSGLIPDVQKPKKTRGTDLSRVYFCEDKALGYGLVPSAFDPGIRRWMSFHDGKSPDNGYSKLQYADWMSAHQNPAFFSFVSHPVVRAYCVFMQKIFLTSAGSYLAIRQQLENKYGLGFPKGDIFPDTPRTKLESEGYGLEEHRVCFKQFLVFVGGNLANETSIRKDGTWRPQIDIINGYRKISPMHLVFKTNSFEASLSYLENLLGLKPYFGWKADREPSFSFPLSEVYDTEIESLCRALYAQDYQEFGYEALGGL